MALMEISVVPLGTGQTSLSEYVAEAVRVIRESGMEFRLHDMGTTVQGDIDQLLELAGRMHKSVFRQGINRVYTVIKIDDRRDREVHPGSKARSVEEKL